MAIKMVEIKERNKIRRVAIILKTLAECSRVASPSQLCILITEEVKQRKLSASKPYTRKAPFSQRVVNTIH